MESNRDRPVGQLFESAVGVVDTEGSQNAITDGWLQTGDGAAIPSLSGFERSHHLSGLFEMAGPLGRRVRLVHGQHDELGGADIDELTDQLRQFIP